MFLNEPTNHTVHISNHSELSIFIALSEALKGHHDIYIYIYTSYILFKNIIIIDTLIQKKKGTNMRYKIIYQ